MEVLVITIGLIVLDVASMMWGADSRDTVNSTEWQRIAGWRGFHGTGTKTDGK